METTTQVELGSQLRVIMVERRPLADDRGENRRAPADPTGDHWSADGARRRGHE
jgi:hypothetical protein